MLRKLIAASAILLGTTFGAAAVPVAGPASGLVAEAPILQVKSWKHGHGRGWGHHRGRHYGWDRGRHRGWYKHHHRRHGHYRRRY
jgi:hypothetical protein